MSAIKILGAKIDGLDMVATLCSVDSYVKLGRESRAMSEGEQAKVMHHIITLNAEILYNAQSDDALLEIINKADMITPDGSGIVWGVRELAGVEVERVTGIDLMQEICRQSKLNGWKVFLFGAKPGVAELAAAKLTEEYGTEVVGSHDGYYQPEDEAAIVEAVNSSGADVLFVAMGAPRQELWIDKYRDSLQVPVAIGVGGSFDVIAGTVKRAPVVFQRLGLEWLWRLIREPWRYKRMLALPRFVRLVKKIKKEQPTSEPVLDDAALKAKNKAKKKQEKQEKQSSKEKE